MKLFYLCHNVRRTMQTVKLLNRYTMDKQLEGVSVRN